MKNLKSQLLAGVLSLPLLLSTGLLHAEKNKIMKNSGSAPADKPAASLSETTPEAKPSTAFSDITPSIVGGNPVTQGDRTYQVYLGGCGGTIIADQWILTAAHCVSSTRPSTARVGVHRLSSNQGETLTVVERIKHPNYNSSTLSHDIALLKVNGTINSNYVRAKLPTAAVMQAAGSPGDNVTVSGWGALSEGGSSPDVLHELTIPLVSNSVCNSSSSYNGRIDSTMICAGVQQGGKDACQGDSGGPLVAEYQNQIYSMGTVSWGDGCARPNKYGVYSSTYNFVNWINSKIGGGTTPPGSKLQNGVPATGLSASVGSDVTYTMDVPSDSTDIKFTISGGTGDADLYVRYGSAPTDSAYDCRPYKNGNSETCTGSQSGGTYYVRVKAYSSFSGVTLTGSYNGGTTPPNDPIDESTPNISVNNKSWTRYYYDLPAGYSNLTVSISGGSGDADLYVRHGAESTLSQYDCRPYKNGNSETCTFSNPADGRWYLDLYGYSSASGVTLRFQAE